MDWYYEGERKPENWKNICEAFKKAENTSLQSPIQLCEKTTEKFIYQKSLATRYQLTQFETSFFNHTVHLTPLANEELNVLFFDYKKYILDDIHFHLPSEHQINDESFPLEMHLVHRSRDNELLVVGITVLPNKEPANLEKYRLDSLALNPRISGRGLFVPVDVAKLLPLKMQYFHYTGSLTTPPTIGPVDWIVFKNQTYMRKGLLRAFKENVGKTNRPLQPLRNRTIYLSD
ncbi:carbonic anhydrase [Carnobacterium iners]|uniref:Carbonic anhydrase n=1 Tax=Carnobacterium iners TaxID=1073423 RepID=A0A1X7NF36_9LACT|nr:carbonic anhydrase family protein [Carnobacterium iners]SEK38877.1 carbonic anhydrase [Carnobacterium iners]SMH36300.1 carbonic anhydrase [Carnobacterium iners]